MDEYFGLFSLKNHDLQVFWHDGEPNSGMAGFRYGRGDWIVFLLDLMHLDFLKIGLGFSALLFKLFISLQTHWADCGLFRRAWSK
jgi:hypothetical protein